MASEQTINQISKALGEVDDGPLAQISAVIEELGEETALELLAETEKIEKSGGLMRGDGSGRRSPGGVYFFLARQKLPREVRARIFNDKMPRAPKPPGAVTPPPPASSRPGAPPPSTPGAPRRRVFEVVPASKPPHSQGRFERNFERGFDRDRGHDRPDRGGFDRHERSEARHHEPRAGFEPRAPWPPKPAPGAYVPPELPSAVGRAKARQEITAALAGVNPSDQYQVLLDLIAELHAQYGGEVPKSDAPPASVAQPPASQIPASQPPASQPPASQPPASRAASSEPPPASQPPASRAASSEPPPSSDRPAATKSARATKPRATSKTATAKTRSRA